jgi:dTDP-4-amino-4,6-dideoxygalactose transaminase
MSGSIPFSNVKLQYEKLKEETLSTIDSVLSSGILLDGPQVNTLIDNLKEQTGREHAIVTHSGTVALQIIGEYYKNYHVCLPAISFPATANAFAVAGNRLHFYDVDNYGVMVPLKGPSDLMCPVGLYGMPVDRKSYNSEYFVEDACQSWLSPLKSDHTQVISFDPTKNLASIGNGGAIVTNDSNLAAFARAYINHGKTANGFTMAGSNVRMSELECAVLNLKFQYIDMWQMRRRIMAKYMISFLNCPTLIDASNVEIHGLQKFVIKVDNRDTFVANMKERGIECKIHYRQALSDLPHLKENGAPPYNYYEKFIKGVVSLPFYPEMSNVQVQHIVDSTNECLLLK